MDANSDHGACRCGYHRILGFSVFAYLSSVFLITPVPGLSRLTFAFMGLMFVAVIVFWFRHKIQIPRDPMILAFLVFVSFALISIVWAHSPATTLTRGLGLLFSVIAAIVIMVSLHNGIGVWPFGMAAFVGGGVQAVVGLQQFLGGGVGRAAGLTPNPNELGILLTLAAMALLWWQKPRGIGTAVSLFFLTVAVLTTGSRKVIASAAAYLFLFQFRFWESKRASYAALATTSFLLASVLSMFLLTVDVPIPVIDQEIVLLDRSETLLAGSDDSGAARVFLAQRAVEIWQASPWIGHGLDNFRAISGLQTYAHNNYVDLLAGVGIVGVALYYAVHAILIYRTVYIDRLSSWNSKFVFSFVVLLLTWEVAAVLYPERLLWCFFAVASHLTFSAAGRDSGGQGLDGPAPLDAPVPEPHLEPAATGAT